MLTRPLRVTATLLAAALAAWVVAAQQMRGMDAGPGTNLGGLGWYLGIWVTMTAAMMLPSAAPMVLAYSSFSRSRRSGTFVAGYLAAWTLFGLAAYVVYRLVAGAGIDWLRWERGGPYVAGAALAAAGLYQLTPLKEVCLRHCRGPLRYLVRGWREGRLGRFAARRQPDRGVHRLRRCAVPAAPRVRGRPELDPKLLAERFGLPRPDVLQRLHAHRLQPQSLYRRIRDVLV